MVPPFPPIPTLHQTSNMRSGQALRLDKRRWRSLRASSRGAEHKCTSITVSLPSHQSLTPTGPRLPSLTSPNPDRKSHHKIPRNPLRLSLPVLWRHFATRRQRIKQLRHCNRPQHTLPQHKNRRQWHPQIHPLHLSPRPLLRRKSRQPLRPRQQKRHRRTRRRLRTHARRRTGAARQRE